ncbi:MAG: UPF0182 family protein [Frankiales bacterium]|nr:UPF0182 family protein [Frankiales bacterium]
MTFASPAAGGGRGGRPASASRSRRNRALIWTLVVIGVIVLGFSLFSGFYTDLLWYESVDATNVFSTQLLTRLALLVVFGGLMAVIVGVNMWIAYRVRPVFRQLSPEQASLERYREALDPLRRVAVIGIPLILGLLAGVSATSEWKDWLLFRNSTAFGTTDAVFGVDLSFYVFTLPFLRFVVGFLFAAVVLAFLASLVVHYIYGGIRLQPADDRMSRAAQAHLAVLIGVFVLLKAAAYWLDRYEVTLSTDDFVPGVTYKDANALIPGQTILMYISVICAVLFFVSAFRRGLTLATTSLVLLAGSAIVIGSLYPAFVQQFQVRPTEQVREAPYIQNNIDATRAAYGLDGVTVQNYAASPSASTDAIKASSGTLDNIRLLDPAVVGPTFQQYQANRTYYRFPDSLDIDRYTLGDKQRGTVIGVREVNLNGIDPSQRSWAVDHVVYTHGFGVVAAYDNTVTSAGAPSFFEQGLPPSGLLTIDQPRIYFGEYSPQYSIVGAPAGSEPRELDYATDSGSTNYTYTGTGGIPVGSPLNRLLFAIKYQDSNIILSDLINSDSRILEVRDPRDRVEKVAPWLQVDGDPYPIVADGRVLWVVDGYTTTDQYPNSTPISFGDATTDTLTTQAKNVAGQTRDNVNYIRNSVKATVDAYDGTVTLYQWDQSDPILATWMKAFPGSVQPLSSMPPSVLEHVRYPEDIFKVQRQIFTRYHVTDPTGFYTGNDFWTVPNDPTTSATAPVAAQPPYYLQVQPVGSATPVFSLTTTLAPQKRNTLAAFMAVNSEPGPGYGKISVLQLPSTTTIPGPAQVQNNFKSDPVASKDITLLDAGGSDVVFGNLLSLPVAGGVLYVEPLYVRQAGSEGFPLLRKVFAGFGNKVAYEDTLGQALASVFSGSGVVVPPGTGDGGDTGTGSPSPSPSSQLTLQQQLTAALAEAQAAYDAGVKALAANDFTAYGAAQKRLERALAAAAAAQAALTGSTSTASPSASPSATPQAAATSPPSPSASAAAA